MVQNLLLQHLHMHQNKFVMLQLVEIIILEMFLIHLIFLLNFDLSILIKIYKNVLKINYLITLKEPVDATLALAVDANEPRLG
jgi:hypothetical protein